MQQKESDRSVGGFFGGLTDGVFGGADWPGRIRYMQADYGESGYRSNALPPPLD